jgi:hypothetical protein
VKGGTELGRVGVDGEAIGVGQRHGRSVVVGRSIRSRPGAG